MVSQRFASDIFATSLPGLLLMTIFELSNIRASIVPHAVLASLSQNIAIQTNPYPISFFTLPTPNQRKTCIKHTFLTKKIMQKNLFNRPTYPIFFIPLQETNNIFFLA